MITHSTPVDEDADTQAFLTMREHTRCFDTLSRWFEHYPHFLLSRNLIPPGSSVGVNLTIQSGVYLDSIRDKGSMCINAALRIYTPVTAHPLLHKETAHSSGPTRAVFEHTVPLELFMTDWPIITAHVATMYIDQGGRNFDSYFTGSCIESLSVAMARHFPDIPLRHLQDLRDAGMFDSLDDTNAVRIFIRDMLFDSRRSQPAVGLPPQLSF